MTVRAAVTSWLKAKLGRIRVSTVALIAVFSLLLWVHQTFPPEREANDAPAPAVVPPGFVPDPEYTWVPRTNVRTAAPIYTTTTPTSPTEPTSPSATTTPTDSPGPTPTSPATGRNPVGSQPPGPPTGTSTPPKPPARNTTSAGPTTPTTVPAR